MNKKTFSLVSKIPISKPAKLLLHYGFFAVLCQSVMILFCILCEDSSVSDEVLRYRYVPYLEYPLMSLSILIGGALLIDWVIPKQ